MPDKERILAANIKEETDTTCKTELQAISDSEVIFKFYCIEPGQGATMIVYHTNIDEKTTQVVGKIKGG